MHAVRECVNLSDVNPSSIVAICCAGTSSTVIAVDRETFLSDPLSCGWILELLAKQPP